MRNPDQPNLPSRISYLQSPISHLPSPSSPPLAFPAPSLHDPRPMKNTDFPILDFVLTNYKNFNARATRDALIAYWRHIEGGGKMFWAVAGAMSSAQLGITLAPAIRAGLIHGLSVTGANLRSRCSAWSPTTTTRTSPTTATSPRRTTPRSSTTACAGSPTPASRRTRPSARWRRSSCPCGRARPRTASGASGTSISTS
jgi:hypothetical protein